MLRMILKWNVDDVGNALRCACCVCTWGGAITLSDVPCRGNRVVKESKHLRKGMVRSFNLSMVFALDDTMFHTLDVVYVRGRGVVTLSDVPCVEN